MSETFHFDTLVNRNGMGCAKWDRRTPAEKTAGIVPMSIADMEYPCAPCVVEAVQKAAAHGLYGYTDPTDAYREAVCGWMLRRHGWLVNPEEIVVAGGVVPTLSVAIRALTKPGDKVIIQNPGYYPFKACIAENGREIVSNRLVPGDDGRYRMDFDSLRALARDPRATMLLLCSPHNPVGRVWTADELNELADICLENNLIVVSDEIHFDLELTRKHLPLPLAAPQLREKCIVCTATSKTFNLAGLQLANVIIPSEILRAAFSRRLAADGFGNMSYFGYHATLAAYNEGGPWVDALLDAVCRNFLFFESWLKANLPQIKLLPAEGTYLAWTDWRALGMTDEQLKHFARDEAMLFLDEGTMFGPGGEGHMRFNLALPQAELEKALTRLKTAAQARKLI